MVIHLKLISMKITKLLFAIVLTIVVTVQGIAQKTLSNIIKKGEIRIGMTGTQPPFSMRAKNDELIGYEVDLAKLLAESMGVKLKIVELPFYELLPTLQDGKIDAIMSGMTITPERNLKALFAGPYTMSGKSILTKSRVLAGISEVAEANLKKYKITCLKGSTSEKFARAYLPNTEIIPVENYEVAVDMVLNDQADGLVADFPICLVTILRHQDEGLVTLDDALTLEPIGMALPPRDPQFLNLVENYLSALELTGALEILDEMWSGGREWLSDIK